MAMAEHFVSLFPAVDILVNDAGLSFPEKLVDLDVAHWDATLAVNLRAPALITKVIAAKMIAQGYGTIVNISSNASVAGIEEHAAYCASKFGLDGLTKVMAVELGPHGIRVNAIAPGPFDTDMMNHIRKDPQRLAEYGPGQGQDPAGALRLSEGNHRRGVVPGLGGGRHDPRGNPDHRRRGKCQTLLKAALPW